MPDAKVYAEPGKNMTGKATGAAVTGGRLLKVAGTKPVDGPTPVVAAGAGEAVFGVAGHDAAQNGLVHVIRGGVVGLRAGENITAGDKLRVGAAGVVMVWDPTTAVAANPTGTVTVTGDAQADVPLTLVAGAITVTNAADVIGIALADIANGADGPVALNI